MAESPEFTASVRAATDWLRNATRHLSEDERHEGIALFDAALLVGQADARAEALRPLEALADMWEQRYGDDSIDQEIAEIRALVPASPETAAPSPTAPTETSTTAEPAEPAEPSESAEPVRSAAEEKARKDAIGRLMTIVPLPTPEQRRIQAEWVLDGLLAVMNARPAVVITRHVYDNGEYA